MDKKEYRILEHQGLFYVQIKVVTEVKKNWINDTLKGLFPFTPLFVPWALWREYQHRNDKPEIKVEWYNTNAFGTKPIYGHFSMPAILPFKTLDEAKARITLLTTPDKIHEV